MSDFPTYLQQYKPNSDLSTNDNIKNLIQAIADNDRPQYEQALVNFVVNEYNNFDFVIENDQREKLWNALVDLTSKSTDNEVLAIAFTAFRILSRNKSSVNKLVTKQWIDLVISYIGLNDATFDYPDDALCRIEEGQKVLWNTLFNSTDQVEHSLKNGLLDKLLGRISVYDQVHVPDSIKFYDIKLIFGLTALSVSVREKVEQSDGIKILMAVLKVILKEAAEGTSTPPYLEEHKADVACQTLKALFNVVYSCNEYDNDDTFKELTGVLRNYLLATTPSLEKTWQLRNDVINLLSSVPPKFYTELITTIDESNPLPKSLRFEHSNMMVFHEILMLLEAKFNDDSIIGRQLEVYSPVLTVLFKGASTHRSIRKYLRQQILPPLKDLENRPEDTNTLRGHLCKFLTCPITQIKTLVSELLFVLCKCNVSRMIKYTGYGNAAGLLAHRGLLGGKRDAEAANYNSDSEDSETEEYLEQKHLVNPVLGCVEKVHPNPMEGMTDEQKEYEALKLVDHINNLTKSGIIQPCRVGADGKPHPIDHVLQLQEGLKAQQITNNDSDSD